MKAVVFESTRRVAVHDVPDARVQEPTDALLRLTSSALCGTDHTFAVDVLACPHEARRSGARRVRWLVRPRRDLAALRIAGRARPTSRQGPTALNIRPFAFFTRVSAVPKHDASLVNT
jgi:hypothetical protein